MYRSYKKKKNTKIYIVQSQHLPTFHRQQQQQQQLKQLQKQEKQLKILNTTTARIRIREN